MFFSFLWWHVKHVNDVTLGIEKAVCRVDDSSIAPDLRNFLIVHFFSSAPTVIFLLLYEFGHDRRRINYLTIIYKCINRWTVLQYTMVGHKSSVQKTVRCRLWFYHYRHYAHRICYCLGDMCEIFRRGKYSVLLWIIAVFLIYNDGFIY